MKTIKIISSSIMIILTCLTLSSFAAAPVFEIGTATVNGQPVGYPIHNNGLVSFGIYNLFSLDFRAVDPDGCSTIIYSLSPSTQFTPPPPWGSGANAGLVFSSILPATITGNQWMNFSTRPETPMGGALIVVAKDCNNEFSMLTLHFEYILPVELSSFSSTVNENDVRLDWTTSSESNNSGFEIERSSANTETWGKIASIGGAGNSTQPVSYSYTDKGLSIGSYHYRLKQIDFNGNYEYHNLGSEVVISFAASFELSQNYPNPFNPSTSIRFNLPVDGNVSLIIYDNRGREVSTLVNGFKTAGYYDVSFNGASLSSGVYFYKVKFSSEGQSSEKVMKMSLVK